MTSKVKGAVLMLVICAIVITVIVLMMMPALQRSRGSASSGGPYEGTQVARDGMRAGEAGTPFPGSRPSLDEEVWVIARSEREPEERSDAPGTGALMARIPGKEEKVAVPLKHTDVQAHLSAYIASVNVTQKFHNPYDEKIEASYVFPLPQNAAVNEFIMTIGGRRIRGIIREREEAERAYRQARARGHVASLLTQERPNIFTQKVANIEPGKEVDVNVKYFNTMHYKDGWYEFVFPMVVGPRFNPPGSQNGIGAVARGRPGISGQKTEVEYLKPGERSGHDISLEAEIEAGVAIEEIACKSHVIRKRRLSPGHVKVQLSELDSIPNKDFVLRYRVAGKRVKSAMLTHTDERGGFFTLMLFPPEDFSSLPRKPLELVFVLDCSGSMRGRPLAQSKAAVERALASMKPDDTFQIIRFSNNSSQLGARPLRATQENVAKGMRYVSSLHGSGGTMMIEGIKAALDFPHDPRRLRFVCFLTDGYIGNEKSILAAVDNKIGTSRIFSFGIGSSPNRYLLDRMAKIGRGAVAYLGVRESAAEVMDTFFQRIGHPALTDVKVDWGDMQVSEVYPAQVPDLFVGRPVILTGRVSGSGQARVTVKGETARGMDRVAIPVRYGKGGSSHEGLAEVWARRKIAHLAEQAIRGKLYEPERRITQVALNFGLMSHYTAFIAVDSLSRTRGDHGTTVKVPVPVPEGVRYDTTVRETSCN